MLLLICAYSSHKRKDAFFSCNLNSEHKLEKCFPPKHRLWWKLLGDTRNRRFYQKKITMILGENYFLGRFFKTGLLAASDFFYICGRLIACVGFAVDIRFLMLSNRSVVALRQNTIHPRLQKLCM